MDLRALAFDTLQLLSRGDYEAPSGARVKLGTEVRAALAGTKTWTPEALTALPPPGPARPSLRVEVTAESTLEAGRRLVHGGAERVAVLNFASALNPGGGFLNGARAQEEALCRCSALYPCLEAQRGYYAANQALGSSEYTDHLITSPAVPFFRDDALALVDRPVSLDVITSPAPYAKDTPPLAPEVLERVFRRRGRQVLAVAAHQGQRALVLGAWGCGAFGNEPRLVGRVFAELLAAHGGGFDHVVFGILEAQGVTTKRDAFTAALRARGLLR